MIQEVNKITLISVNHRIEKPKTLFEVFQNVQIKKYSFKSFPQKHVHQGGWGTKVNQPSRFPC